MSKFFVTNDCTQLLQCRVLHGRPHVPVSSKQFDFDGNRYTFITLQIYAGMKSLSRRLGLESQDGLET